MGKKIAIVGAGAVGGYAGAHMVQAGEDVTFIDPWPEHVEHMRKHGLRISHGTSSEEFTTPVRALHLTEAQQLSKEAPIALSNVMIFCKVCNRGVRTGVAYDEGDGHKYLFCKSCRKNGRTSRYRGYDRDEIRPLIITVFTPRFRQRRSRFGQISVSIMMKRRGFTTSSVRRDANVQSNGK